MLHSVAHVHSSCYSIPHHDEDGNEHGADGVSKHPVKEVNERGGDNNTDTAQGIGQNVQEYTCDS